MSDSSQTVTLPSTVADGTETLEQYHERMARANAAAAAGGATDVTGDDSVQVDYFGFSNQEKVMLPDGRSYVLISALNEGGRRNYLNKVNKEVVISKGTGDARMQMANGDERRVLLKEAIVGWNLQTRASDGKLVDVQFKESKLNDFLDKANPTVIDIIDKAVRAQNPWLNQDVTLDELLKQRDDLDEEIAKKKLEEEGKES
jgi:hypothetical protein